jgi:hypothetical protein
VNLGFPPQIPSSQTSTRPPKIDGMLTLRATQGMIKFFDFFHKCKEVVEEIEAPVS